MAISATQKRRRSTVSITNKNKFQQTVLQNTAEVNHPEIRGKTVRKKPAPDPRKRAREEKKLINAARLPDLVPEYGTQVIWSLALLKIHVKLPGIPVDHIHYLPSETEFHVDTHTYRQKHFVVHFRYPGDIVVSLPNDHEPEAELEYKGKVPVLTATLKIADWGRLAAKRDQILADKQKRISEAKQRKLEKKAAKRNAGDAVNDSAFYFGQARAPEPINIDNSIDIKIKLEDSDSNAEKSYDVRLLEELEASASTSVKHEPSDLDSHEPTSNNYVHSSGSPDKLQVKRSQSLRKEKSASDLSSNADDVKVKRRKVFVDKHHQLSIVEQVGTKLEEQELRALNNEGQKQEHLKQKEQKSAERREHKKKAKMQLQQKALELLNQKRRDTKKAIDSSENDEHDVPSGRRSVSFAK